MKNITKIAVIASIALTSFLYSQEAKVASSVSSETKSIDGSKSPTTPDKSIVETEKTPEKAAAEAEEAAKKALRQKISLLSAECAKMDAENDLARTKLEEQLFPINDTKIRSNAKIELENLKSSLETLELDAEKRVIEVNLSLKKVKESLAMLERNNALNEKSLDLRIVKAEKELEWARQQLALTQSEMEAKARTMVIDGEKKYLKEPLVEGTLYISDRRIDFNGAVTQELADDVISKINFFNNQNKEYPIFIVIDSSPGGSAFAGYQILKAMESSKAPVYVVVKSFAASMAAIITTLAEKSYCFENTTILHHQASAGTRGNMTQMREQYATLSNWLNELNTRISKKIGKPYDEFVKEMYANVSTGDWALFGREAVEKKWVSGIVKNVIEDSFLKKTAQKVNLMSLFGQKTEVKTDDRGQKYFILPRLQPGDVWLIADPQNRFRTR